MAFALNSSNWLAATAEPRCALERLARAVFERHTTGVDFNPATSGAEWWAQVRRGGDKHESIEFHWDVDEHFCDLPGGGGVHVHPHLSTVTYLTAVGAPTLVLDAKAPKNATKGAIEQVYGAVPSGAISFPRLGKTIVFDGSKLHGAVPPAKGSGAPNGERRVTFLVNVWLNHRPHAVEPLPAKLAKSMSQQWKPHPTLGAFLRDLKPPPKFVVEGSVVADAYQNSQQQQLPRPAASIDPPSASTPPLQLLQVAFGRNDKVHALRALVPHSLSEERAPPIRKEGEEEEEREQPRRICRSRIDWYSEAAARSWGPNDCGCAQADRRSGSVEHMSVSAAAPWSVASAHSRRTDDRITHVDDDWWNS